MEIHRYTLDNGLKLVLSPIKESSVVSLNLTYKVGSKNELRGRTGTAHLFEHLMFEGSKSLAKGKFDNYCTKAGGNNNAYTTYDSTSYIMTLPSNQLELALWLESDRLAGFAVTEEALVTQQKVVTEEIKQTVFDQPYGRWREYLAEYAFTKDSPYSWEVHGTVEDVNNCDLNYLEKFYNTYYQPSNACLAISGGFDVDSTIKTVNSYFGNIENKERTIKSLDFNELQKLKPSNFSFEDSVPHNAVFLNYHLPGFTNDIVLISDLISILSTVGKSSRIYKKLINELQVASSVGSYLDRREMASLLTFYAVAADENITPDTISNELQNELNKIVDNVTNYELDKAINQITTHLAYELQSTSGIAETLSHLTLFQNDPYKINTLIERYKSITLNDVYKFMSFLTEENRVEIDVVAKNAN